MLAPQTSRPRRPYFGPRNRDSKQQLPLQSHCQLQEEQLELKSNQLQVISTATACGGMCLAYVAPVTPPVFFRLTVVRATPVETYWDFGQDRQVMVINGEVAFRRCHGV